MNRFGYYSTSSAVRRLQLESSRTGSFNKTAQKYKQKMTPDTLGLHLLITGGQLLTITIDSRNTTLGTG